MFPGGHSLPVYCSSEIMMNETEEDKKALLPNAVTPLAFQKKSMEGVRLLSL